MTGVAPTPNPQDMAMVPSGQLPTDQTTGLAGSPALMPAGGGAMQSMQAAGGGGVPGGGGAMSFSPEMWGAATGVGGVGMGGAVTPAGAGATGGGSAGKMSVAGARLRSEADMGALVYQVSSLQIFTANHVLGFLFQRIPVGQSW